MMREYKRYDEYKDSGIEWINEIPEDWKLNKVKYIGDDNIYYPIGDGDHGSISSDEYTDSGIPYIRVQNLSWGFDIKYDGLVYIDRRTHLLNKKSKIVPGDILVAKTGATVGKTAIVPDSISEANTTSSVAKITVDKKLYDNKLIAYIMSSNIIKEQIYEVSTLKSAQPGFNIDQLIEFVFPHPVNKKEQQKISSFLDKKTVEIDEIITKKEKLIDHLEKYKKSVITEAVTKGKLGDKYITEDGELVDEIEMKDSGVEWVGEIPEYWEVNRIKFNNLINPNKSEINYKDMEVSFVPMEYIKDGVIEDQDSKKLDEVYDGYSYFTEQDILLAKVTPCFENNNIGIASNLKNSIGFGTTEVHVIRSLDDFNRYIFYLFQSKHFKNKGKSVMYGAGGLKRVPTDFVENYFYGRPEYEIQKLISNHLDQKTQQISNLINKTKESIEKYKEYKKSLIFEAVTGKIDLRDYELEGGEKLAEHNNSSETERECLSAVD